MIAIGSEWMTKIGSKLVPVKIESVREPQQIRDEQCMWVEVEGAPIRYAVRNMDTGTVLTKPRTADQLFQKGN